ncbi:Gamma-tubulin complex component 2 [Nymphon striatum]|nr:Gamma-tubulin complex component 2 [Nymphon striatum]
MADIKVAHLVTQLLHLLGAKDQPVEVYEKLLLKNKTSQTNEPSMPHGIVKELAKSSKNPKEFISKYDKLRITRGQDIDSLIIFLSKITSDEKTKQKLLKVSKKKDISVISSSQMTATDLIQLKDRLQRESLIGTAKNLSTVNIPDLSTQNKSASVKIPTVPSWVTSRRYMTMNFVIDSDSSFDSAETGMLGSIPVSAQENCLIGDLMFCLEGVEGEYIHCQGKQSHQSQITFTIDENIDKSLRELTNRILPLCSNFSTVVEFIEERSLFKYGLVNHALCAAMRSLLKDYFVLIAQLEHQHQQGFLTLQKMWFYLQPTMLTMENLATVVKTIVMGNCRGGSVLSLLHNKTTSSSGDVKIQDLCLYLTQAATVPYFGILEKWIYRGLICDPYMEFLIEDNEIIQKEHLPEDYSQKVQCPQAEKLSYSCRERHCIDSIEKAYNYASQNLLHYLMKEKDLVGILRSVKHYFLLDKGDFIVEFMDIAEEEFGKNICNIIPTRLESLVELALRTSSANHDTYKDNLKVELLPYNLVFQMSKILSIETKAEDEFKSPADFKLSGLEAFSFDYEVKWPLSLILNRKAIACYQMLFRHLFLSKHVERMLCNVWMKNKVARKSSATSEQRQTSALGAKMLYFIQNLEYYMMFEVLEPNWNMFLTQLQNVTNVDDVLKCHTDLLNVCLKDCMLTSHQLLGLVNDIMKTCLSFAEFSMSRYDVSENGIMTESVTSIPEEQPTFEEFENEMKRSEKASNLPFSSMIENYDKEFTSLIIHLLNELQDVGCDNYNNKLINMLYRLDFNGYYNSLAADR